MQSWDSWGPEDKEQVSSLNVTNNLQNNAHINSSQYAGYHGNNVPKPHPHHMKGTPEPEPEPDVDFFETMKPQIKRAAKVKYLKLIYH